MELVPRRLLQWRLAPQDTNGKYYPAANVKRSGAVLYREDEVIQHNWAFG